VRELENLLHRATALAQGSRIELEDLGLPEEGPTEPLLPESQPLPPQAQAAVQEPEVPPPRPLEPLPAEPPLPSDLAAYLDSVERDILERALNRYRYNRTAAGASLGLSLRQMRYRMARLGVGVELPEVAADAGSDELAGAGTNRP